MKYWLNAPDRGKKETEQRIQTIEDHWQTHGFGDWGVFSVEYSTLIGLAGIHFIDGINDVNIGYAFEKTYWGKGFGFEACRVILEFGQNVLNLSHIVAVIGPQNIASIRLIENAVCGSGKR